ncbi:MAG: hypothetical protein ACT4NV_10730 [Rhodoferax sp.]
MKLVWITGLASLALLLGLAAYLAPLQPPLMALFLTFSPDSFGAVVQQWGPRGIALFRSHLPFDGLLLLAYSSFGALLVKNTRVFERSTVPALVWGAMMPVAGVFDAVEDAIHWVATAPDAVLGAGWYLLGGASSCVKTVLFVGFLLAASWHGWRRRRAA